MDADDFHASLQQLRQQLDLINRRTASTLNDSHQHSNKVTHNSTQVGHFPSVIMADNAQQIKHIGATLDALASQQEDRFQRLEHQLNLLSDKLDNLLLNHSRFTPSESSNSSVHQESEPYFQLPFGKSFNLPRRPLDMSHATVADLGGYFFPNCNKYSHTDQQYISDASTFVGRVNRTLCTKSITNIEIFLRGAALRWFHIGLSADGSHIFDDENGEMNMAKFCQSLILLFGIPDCLAPESDVEPLHLMPAFMRSVILEDYAFPALEHARRQGTMSDYEVALSKAIERYNQNPIPITLNSDMAKNKHLLCALACLRRSEFDQKLDMMLARKPDNAKPANAPAENSIKIRSTRNEPRHRLEDSRNQIMQTQVKDCIVKDPVEEVTVAKANIEEPNSTKIEDSKVAKSIETANEPYPPGPTAESCPTTPILPCRISASSLNEAPQMRSSCEQLQETATMDSGEFDYSKLISTEIAKKFGLQPGRRLTHQQRLQLKQQMHMQQMAQLHQNAMKKKTVHTDDSSGNILHQQSSVLATCKRPEYSHADELARTHEHDFTSSLDNGSTSSDNLLVAHQQALMEQFMTPTDEYLQRSEETYDNLPEHTSHHLQHESAHEVRKQNGKIIQDRPRRSEQEENELQQRKRNLLALVDRANRVYQRREPHINPHLYYESGCAAVKESMEQTTTRFERGPLDDRNWTNYAQMLEDHAAAVAEENDHEAEVPPRLALAGNKPMWQKDEATDGAASPNRKAARSAAPTPERFDYLPHSLCYPAGAPASSDSAPPVVAPCERWTPRLPRGRWS